MRRHGFRIDIFVVAYERAYTIILIGFWQDVFYVRLRINKAKGFSPAFSIASRNSGVISIIPFVPGLLSRCNYTPDRRRRHREDRIAIGQFCSRNSLPILHRKRLEPLVPLRDDCVLEILAELRLLQRPSPVEADSAVEFGTSNGLAGASINDKANRRRATANSTSLTLAYAPNSSLSVHFRYDLETSAREVQHTDLPSIPKRTRL